MTTSELTTQRRKDLSERHGLSDDYIYQCLSGKKSMSPAKAMQVERLTNGEISRQMLRRHDYWLIWSDLPDPKEDSYV